MIYKTPQGRTITAQLTLNFVGSDKSFISILKKDNNHNWDEYEDKVTFEIFQELDDSDDDVDYFVGVRGPNKEELNDRQFGKMIGDMDEPFIPLSDESLSRMQIEELIGRYGLNIHLE